MTTKKITWRLHGQGESPDYAEFSLLVEVRDGRVLSAIPEHVKLFRFRDTGGPNPVALRQLLGMREQAALLRVAELLLSPGVEAWLVRAAERST